MLIVFGGLSGTGKTAIARESARQLGAVYLRIDSIEQAIRDSGVPTTWQEVVSREYQPWDRAHV